MPMLEDAEGIEDFTARAMPSASSNAKDHFYAEGIIFDLPKARSGL